MIDRRVGAKVLERPGLVNDLDVRRRISRRQVDQGCVGIRHAHTGADRNGRTAKQRIDTAIVIINIFGRTADIIAIDFVQCATAHMTNSELLGVMVPP
jgi:hypothetical protein